MGAASAVGAGLAAARWASARRERERRTVLADLYPPDVSAELHARKVRRISAQLRGWRSSEPTSLRKRAVSHQVPRAQDPRRADRKIDISDLNAILRIDPERRLCVAEPGVTFVDLVAATLRHGLVPAVVPELKTITLGGAVAGCSIESMSFQHGGFHDTCVEYEVIASTGEVRVCTPDNENRLVFQMLHGTFGTLGIISRLTFRLIPARPFVRVRHERFTRLADFLEAIRAHHRARDVDFMDGFIHSPTDHVLCAADFVARAPYASRYDWTKVYYRSTRERLEDYLRTPDYFFRYDHGVTQVHPRSALARLLLGRFVSSSVVLRVAEKLHWLLPRRSPRVNLDVFLPLSRVPDFVSWYRREFDFFPLWCVPYARVRDYEWLSDRFYQGLGDGLFLDLAVYGMKQRRGRDGHRVMEQKLLELGGMKTLISSNSFSEEEFWTIWNLENYRRVKAVMDPKNLFRDLYVKTCAQQVIAHP